MSEWKPYTFEDGTEVHLLGYTALPPRNDQAWSRVTLAFVKPDGTEAVFCYDRVGDQPL